MSRRHVSMLAAAAAAAAALVGGFLLSGGARAGGPGYGYGAGMMGGGYGPGMAGGVGDANGTVATGSATLLIRHQVAHCHTWSLNGGAFAAHQRVTLERGATLTVIDDDVMPHRLVELAGGAVTMRNGTTMPMMGGFVSQTPGLMNRMGASTTVAFDKAGVYRFRTRAGEDYVPGIATSGADNVLTLTVAVR